MLKVDGCTPGHRWDPHHAQEGQKSSLFIKRGITQTTSLKSTLMHHCIKVGYRDISYIDSYIECILGDFLRISSLLFCISSLHCYFFFGWHNVSHGLYTALHDWQQPLSFLSLLSPAEELSILQGKAPLCLWWWWWSFCHVWIIHLNDIY